VSFPSDRFTNKVLIIQVIGSWCPNCLDETAFFTSLYNKYHSEGLEVISLAYEKPLVFSEKVKSIQRLKNHFNAKYPFLIAGNASKTDVEKELPFLKNVASFPTTIYIDKNGEIRKVYSGFYGPGTGSFFAAFATETTQLIEDMLHENFLN
jgi:thiol-disulfide isomerase/thioredoxin